MGKYKTLVIGDSATCLPFGAMGVDSVVVEETPNLIERVNELIKSGEYAAVFIGEPFMERLNEIVESARYEPLPSIIPIPTIAGSKGFGKRAIRETMKRAAGMDVMGDEG
jgi:V/A-type H+/Na+-transporting ATPase subunit F